jgi:GTP-binding nuclear protein Ran
MINQICNIKTYKVLLVGDSNVGKSSYINRCLTGDFNNDNSIIDKEENNIIINTNKGKYCLNISEITEYNNNDAIIFMFDTMNIETLKNIEKKIQHINNNKIPSILVGNKIDIINQKDKKKIYKQIIKITNKYNMLYYNISAKTNYNFEKPYLNILRLLTNNKQLNFNVDSYPKNNMISVQ